MEKKIFLIDIDNTICKTNKNFYKLSKPYKSRIEVINKLYDQGHTIKFFTSRYMGRSKDNQRIAKSKGYKLTKKQLKEWNCKYNQLIFGKPSYDISIDDKSIFYNNNWFKELNKVYVDKKKFK
jgi:hydroxymethylpyrimidine pyrophosphatase-like HAD family hydrolase